MEECLSPGSLQHLSSSPAQSHVSLLSRGGTFKLNNIQLPCQVLIYLLKEEQEALVDVTTVQEAPEAVMRFSGHAIPTCDHEALHLMHLP